MATIVYAWELGGGLGHLLGFRPIAQALLQRGHRVVALVRDLSRASSTLADLGVTCLPAPFKIRRTPDAIAAPCGLAHMLHNVGFSAAGELRSLVDAWRTLFDWIGPALVVCDHAPTALLALRGRATPCATIGTGFCCVPDGPHLPDFSALMPVDWPRLHADEARMLGTMNAVLTSLGQPPLDRCGQLYAEVDEVFLTTLPELDHFPQRGPVRYWGLVDQPSGVAPEWPQGSGPKIFAYLKPFAVLEPLLQLLTQQRHGTLVFGDEIPLSLRERYGNATLQFADRPIDVAQAARDCDLAILNAGHQTTAAVLLAGKPVLLIPLLAEQALLSHRVEQWGAGRTASATDPAGITAALDELLQNDRFSHASRQFAQRHAAAPLTTSLIADRIESLLRDSYRTI